MLAQGRDLAPRVPVVILPMPVGAVWYGVWIFFEHLTFRRTQEGSLGREDPVMASPKRSLGPGRVKLITSVAGIHQDALQECSIPSSGRHSGWHIAVPPFEGQTQEAELLALWQVSPPQHMIIRGRHFFVCFSGVKSLGSPRMFVNNISKN